jgi:hypothetical protein
MLERCVEGFMKFFKATAAILLGVRVLCRVYGDFWWKRSFIVRM